MNTRPLWVAALSALVASTASAQIAAPATLEPAPVARAQRDADNPLRLIIEAGKLKTRPKGAEADPSFRRVAEARPAPQRIAVARPAEGAPETAPGVLPVAMLPTTVASLSAPASALATTPDTARSEAAATPSSIDNAAPNAGLMDQPDAVEPAQPLVEAQRTAATPAPTPIAALAVPQSGIQLTALPAPELPALGGATSLAERLAPRPPELTSYVEPVVPARLRGRLRGNAEVVIDLKILADGSVAEAIVRSASDKALEPLALEAVRQWRYKPASEGQSHAVQLVFAP